jgi:dTDP-glucose pyrophosphorylase
MTSWQNTLLSTESTILDAMKVIDSSAKQIGLVVDEEGRLLGTVTDGDIRRTILKNIPMSSSVTEIMFRDYTAGKIGDSEEQLLTRMRKKNILQIPVLDEDNRVVGLKTIDEMAGFRNYENWVVLMAGGLGTRLRPLTNDRPKPLLEVSGRPILETIVNRFEKYGFNRFYFSVNYKASMIQQYFLDGSRFGVHIQYLLEQEKLGTAGALSLLPEIPDRSLFVMNGDVITNVNFANILEYHQQHEAMATMCVREYHVQVPFGVAHCDQYYLKDIEEKPLHKFFVNAGIYVMEPEAIARIPENTHMDMPNLFKSLIADGEKTVVFPIREYWIDVGQKKDLDRANSEFESIPDF